MKKEVITVPEFRPLRRSAQQLSDAEARAVLESASSGVLSLIGDGGYPYGVPLSYVCDGEKIYFHCAKSGHKLDAVRACGKASFCVVGRDEVVAAEYTTYYRSVIAFGRIRELTGEAEIRRAAELLGRRYNPTGGEEALAAEIDQAMGRLCALEFTIERLTGKEAKELMKRKKSHDIS